MVTMIGGSGVFGVGEIESNFSSQSPSPDLTEATPSKILVAESPKAKSSLTVSMIKDRSVMKQIKDNIKISSFEIRRGSLSYFDANITGIIRSQSCVRAWIARKKLKQRSNNSLIAQLFHIHF